MTTPSQPFLLTVLTGPHAGASTGFGPSRLRVGGGEGDDVILAGVAPACLTLRAEGEMLRLASRSGAGRHDGQTGFAALPDDGSVVEAAMPATLRLNDETTILLSRLAPSSASRHGWRAGLGMAALALAGGLWLGAQIGPGGDVLPNSAMQAQATEIPRPVAVTVSTAPAPQAEPRPRCDADCIDGVAAMFGSRLADAGLNGLELTPDRGVLRVTGALGPGQAEIWHNQRTRFESEFGQSLPLIIDLTEGQPDPVLAVASVWLGSLPEIRTKSGAALRKGDRTDDGWIVSDIASGVITLSRNGRQVQLRF